MYINMTYLQKFIEMGLKKSRASMMEKNDEVRITAFAFTHQEHSIK